MKLAFVIPWYGDIPGGAENECKRTVENLARRGVNVEVLTTCVKEFLSDWNTDYYKEGIYKVNGIVVRRFKVRKRNTKRFDHINYNRMHNQRIPQAEEQLFVQEMINSDNLYKYIADHGQEYDYFIFIPYMFGTTYYGSKLYPEKSFLIPCLHDEGYAYMSIYKNMFENAAGVVFLSEPEKELANGLFNLNNKQMVSGGGMDTGIAFDPKRFRVKYGITDEFILYAGRRELGKNMPLLIDYFYKYKKNNGSDLKLILIGSGAVEISRKYKTEIIDLGFIPKQDKYDAYAAATLLCQPSVNESFSIVIMESWLCGTPVLVHADCAVTKDHCIKSNGGLYFSNYEEFEECINFYLDDPELSKKMAENGGIYVEDNYDWDKIVERYKAFFSPSRYAIDSTASKVTVSIIILHHSGEDYTINCIKSILSQTYHDFEIIVVASKDRRKIDEILSEFKNNSRIKFVLNNEDLGASWARNKGVDKSEGEYIVFLDNDTIVDKNWLKYLVEKLESDAKIGTVTPKILSMDDPEVVLSCGGYINYQGYGADYGAYRIDKYYKPSHASVFFSTSCCFILRKELFYKLGKFDEEINFFGEDLDFTCRFSLIGLNNIIEPRSIIYHHRTKTDDDGLKIWQLNVQNRIKIMIKILPAFSLIKWLLVEFLIHLFYFYKKRNRKIFLNAWKYNLFVLRKTLDKRRQIRQLTQKRKFPYELLEPTWGTLDQVPILYKKNNRNIDNRISIGSDDADHLITGWVGQSRLYGKNIIYSTETANLFIKKREGDNIWWMRCKSPANKSLEVIFKKDDVEKKYYVNLKRGMNTFQQECNLKPGVYKVYFVGNKLNRIGTINHHINVCFGLKEFRFDNIDSPTTWGRVAEKKRICVVTSQVPFERGGNEYLAEFLVQKLNEYGYDVCMFYTPQNRHYIFRKLIAGYFSNRFVDLDEYNAKQIHQIISLRYPSFAIKHPNHVCWFNHRQREYYDLWDEWIINETRRFKIIGLKRRLERVIIHKLDSYLLKKNVSLIYSQSKNIKDRLLKWGNIPTEVLYPPPLKNEECYCESYDNYIFTISRLSKLKRLDLLITAFKYVKNKDIKCYIAGKGEDYHLLNDLIEKNKLKDRVKLLGFLSDEDALKYYANCRAVFFGPLNEDYGLVSLEAMKSKKALITCEDSGGPTEFVIDGKTGFIAKADPLDIAQKIDIIADDEEKAKEMGYAAYESVKDITWENTIKNLTFRLFK